MATVNVTVVSSNVTANSTTSNITVAQSNTVVTVSNVAPISNTEIRSAIGNTSPILYNSTTGIISLDTSAVFSNTSANNWFTSVTTDNLTEGGSNLYFTDARARLTNSVTTTSPNGNGALNYNNGTGVFQFSPAAVPQTTDDLAPGSNVERQYVSNADLLPRFATPGGILLTANVNIGNTFINETFTDQLSTNDMPHLQLVKFLK